MYLNIVKSKLLCIRIFDYLFTSRNSINPFSKYTLSNKSITVSSLFSKIKKQPVVFLRAPKHFKVGRHHLALEKRALITKFYFNRPVTSKVALTPYSLPSVTRQLTPSLPVHPISKRNNVRVSVEVTFTFIL